MNTDFQPLHVFARDAHGASSMDSEVACTLTVNPVLMAAHVAREQRTPGDAAAAFRASVPAVSTAPLTITF